MQINFYMDAQDKRDFHTFILERGGYLMPEVWTDRRVPRFSSEAEILADWHNLKIFREDIFPSSNFDDPDWITPYPQFNGYFVHGPGMQYSPSWQNEDGIHRGRIFMGLVGPSSFVKPGRPLQDAFLLHANDYLKLQNFYKACCSFIRKKFRRDDAGFYHGPGSDRATMSGMMKLQT